MSQALAEIYQRFILDNFVPSLCLQLGGYAFALALFSASRPQQSKEALTNFWRNRKDWAALQYDVQSFLLETFRVRAILSFALLTFTVKTFPLPTSPIFESHLDGWLIIAAGFVVRDFTGYWIHRLFHSEILFPIHVMHHRTSYFPFGQINHSPLLPNLIRRMITAYLIAFFFGSETAVTAMMIINFLTTSLEFLQHSGLPWKFGYFGYIFVSPHMHALHHSNDRQDYGKNFGLYFSFWDRMFGTYHSRQFTQVRLDTDYDGWSSSKVSPVIDNFVGLFVSVRMLHLQIRSFFKSAKHSTSHHSSFGQNVTSLGKMSPQYESQKEQGARKSKFSREYLRQI